MTRKDVAEVVAAVAIMAILILSGYAIGRLDGHMKAIERQQQVAPKGQ